MQKSKLGISVGLLGAILFMAAILEPLAAIIIAGYILIAEENVWLRRTAVKSTVILIAFAALNVIIYLIPDFIDVIENLICIFKDDYYSGDFVSFINRLVSFISSVFDYIKVILFALLALKSLTQSTIIIPAIDKFINNHIN